MTAKRVNITIDEDLLMGIDACAKNYDMNRSEYIAFCIELLEEMNAWNALEEVAYEKYHAPYFKPRKYHMEQAAKYCEVVVTKEVDASVFSDNYL